MWWLEGALAVQMACTHTAAMAVLARLGGGHGSELRVAALGSAAARLLRAYATQVEVLRRLRHGGQWTRLSCRTFAANAVRLQLHALAYNLANFLRTLATPEPIKDWSLTSLKEKLIKIGAKIVSHGRYVAFQMAEVAVPRQMFQEILRLIAELRPKPPPTPA